VPHTVQIETGQIGPDSSSSRFVGVAFPCISDSSVRLVVRYEIDLATSDMDCESAHYSSDIATVKHLPLLLTLSLTANIALMVFIAVRHSAKEDIRNASPSVRSTPKGSAHASPALGAFASDAIELPVLAAQLRTKRFPPALIRAIVTAQIRAQFAARYQSIYDAAASLPYWQGGITAMFSDPKLEMARRKIDREVSDRVDQVLGPPTDELTESQQADRQRQYGGLSLEKIATLQRITEDYRDLSNQVSLDSRGITLAEDREKQALLKAEQRADIARLLTSEELDEYDLRSSPTASQLRSRLAAFEPREQEFRALYKIYATLDITFEAGAELSPERRRERTEAEQQLAPKIEAALGAQRYADYLRTTNRPRSGAP
jgi:hypothetical protein